MEPYKDSFGYIPCKIDVSFDGGKIASCENLAEIIEQDPIVLYGYGDMFRITATHEISLYAKNPAEVETLRSRTSGFLIHFIGFLFGFRCQFWNWWLDGDFRQKSSTDFTVNSSSLQKILDHALQFWKNLNDKQKTVLTNLLFLHELGGCISSDWRRFQVEYQVVDAIFAFGT